MLGRPGLECTGGSFPVVHVQEHISSMHYRLKAFSAIRVYATFGYTHFLDQAGYEKWGYCPRFYGGLRTGSGLALSIHPDCYRSVINQVHFHIRAKAPSLDRHPLLAKQAREQFIKPSSLVG